MIRSPTRLALVLTLVLMAWSLPCHAERPPRTVQMVFLGNLRGNTTLFGQDGTLKPAPCWQVPELIQQLTGLPNSDTLIVSAGNLSSRSAIPSFLLRGAIAFAWEKACRAQLAVVGVEELRQVRSARERRRDTHTRIWTNHVPSTPEPAFPEWRRITLADESWVVLGLISQKQLADVPLDDWGVRDVESPQRAIYRARAAHAETTRFLIVADIPSQDLPDLLQAVPAHSVVISHQRPSPMAKNLARQREIVLASPPSANQALLTVRLRRRIYRALDAEVRQLPLKYGNVRAAERLFRPWALPLAKALAVPLHILDSEKLAPPPFFRFRPSLLAGFVRDELRADVGLMALERNPLLEARVIDHRIALTAFPNKMLRLYRMQGGTLKALFFLLARGSFPYRVALAGAEIRMLGHGLPEMAVQGKPVVEDVWYRLAIGETLYADPAVQALLDQANHTTPRGTTFWDALVTHLAREPKENRIIERDRE